MTEPVTLHHGYYLIDTTAWLDQRTGTHHEQHSNDLQDFVGCDVFDEYTPSMDIDARLRLWCAACGWQVAEGAPIYHDDECLTTAVSIVLAATPPGPSVEALALVSVDGGAPQVYTDVTTDDGSWLDAKSIEIACPAGSSWTWDGGAYLIIADGAEQRLTTVFGLGMPVISRCRDCAAFDDGTTDQMCPCPGVAIYCPDCGQRCRVALPEVATFAGALR
jgi:hypothetical protein